VLAGSDCQLLETLRYLGSIPLWYGVPTVSPKNFSIAAKTARLLIVRAQA
jgi:hypothetical protein